MCSKERHGRTVTVAVRQGVRVNPGRRGPRGKHVLETGHVDVRARVTAFDGAAFAGGAPPAPCRRLSYRSGRRSVLRRVRGGFGYSRTGVLLRCVARRSRRLSWPAGGRISACAGISLQLLGLQVVSGERVTNKATFTVSLWSGHLCGRHPATVAREGVKGRVPSRPCAAAAAAASCAELWAPERGQRGALADLRQPSPLLRGGKAAMN